MAADPFLGFCTATVRFERLLGRGAMGAVYQGIQLSLQRPVAIKVIAPHLLEDPAYLARFEREAHTVGRLVHPNIISCHDFGPCEGPDGERIYLMVMEFVDGWSLGHLAKTRKLQVRQVLDLHRQAAEGLFAAHAIGIIHRDIKPDNIMITREGVAKLADFGLARSLSNESDITMAGSILGSPAYMSPEACQGEEPTAKSDIYSLGCSLIQTLTGVVAFPAASGLAMMQMHITEPVPRLADRRSDLAMLQPLIDACLAKKPEQRIADARLLARQIGEYTPTISRSVIAGRLEIKPGGSGRGETGGGSSAVAQTIATRNPSKAARPWWRWPSTPLGRRRFAIGISLLVPCAGLLMAMVSLTHRQVPAPAEPEAGRTASTQDPQPAPAPVPTPTPASAPTAATTVAPAPTDAADLDALAQAEALVRQGHLDEAQDALDKLVVSGDLKVRKHAVAAQLADAWQQQQTAASSALDAAEALIASQPKAALDQLNAMDIPDHFPDLLKRHDDLVLKAEGAPRGVPPVPEQDESHMVRLAPFMCQAIDPADPALPDPVPGGVTRFFRSQASAHTKNLQALGLRLPIGGDAGHGGVLLLVHGGVKRTLQVLLHQRGQARMQLLSSSQLSGTGWELVHLPLNDSHDQRTLFMISDGGAASFFLAAALWCPDWVPHWHNLHVVPGSLLLAPGGLESAVARLSAATPGFPDYSKIRIGLPEEVIQSQKDHGHVVVNLIRQSLGLDALSTADLDSQLSGILVPYHAFPVRAEMVRDGGDQVQFYLHYIPTSVAPSAAMIEDWATHFRDALTNPHPLLPILVLGPDCWYQNLFPAWQACISQLQQKVPEMPVIDLAQLPLMRTAAGEIVDPTDANGKTEYSRSFSNALILLHARIASLMKRR